MASKSVRYNLRVWGWSLLLLQLLFQLTSAQSASCSHQCSPLSQCIQLKNLLLKPTAENIFILRQATCSRGNDPLVCCPAVTSPASLLPKNCGQGTQLDMVLGGTEAPIHSHPWIALLAYESLNGTGEDFLCGGSAISERYILTAAQCLDTSHIVRRRLKFIRLGEWDTTTEVDCQETLHGFRSCSPPHQDFLFEDIIIHPEFNMSPPVLNDIALIRLDRPIDFSGQWIQPVCLPPQGMDLRGRAGQREPLLAGWGYTENFKFEASDRLMHVSLPFVDKANCSSVFNRDLGEGQICLGGQSGKDSCNGDSGNPVVLSGPKGPPFLQIGIVSFGSTVCGQNNVPSVYTSVSHYRDWIEQNLKP